MTTDLDAADGEAANKAAVATKSQRYAALYLAAFAACVPVSWMPNWARWLPSSLVGFCLVSAFSMAVVLTHLAKAKRFYGAKDGVLRNHRRMNAFAVGFLVYALGAVWGRWPVPALAVVSAAVISFVGYSTCQLRLDSASFRVRHDRLAVQKQQGWSNLARRLKARACSALPVRTARVRRHLLQPELHQPLLLPVSQRCSHLAFI